MGDSTCVACGECAAVCPTGALVNKVLTIPTTPVKALKAVDSVCPYCGVGCALTYHVDVAANRIVYASGREQPGNHERLCVKGRYGFDYATHPQRLTTPLIRVRSYPKGPLSKDVRGEGDGRAQAGRARRLRRGAPRTSARPPGTRRSTSSRSASATSATTHGAGRARGLRLGQVLERGGLPLPEAHPRGLGHQQRRPLHAALPRVVGRGALRGHRHGRRHDDLRRHPQRRRGALHGHELVAQPPRRRVLLQGGGAPRDQARSSSTRARPTSRSTPGASCRSSRARDVAFYNAIMHVIIAEGLEDERLHRRADRGLRGARANVAKYPPEVARRRLRHPRRDDPRGRARDAARRSSMVVFWGMGISQHVHGTDNARCLIALCLLTGNVGKPGAGLHPLRGQNNVQGASDSGLIPMFYPDYQRVEVEANRVEVREGLGPAARPQARPDRRRDHEGGARPQGPRHVHDGREPVHLRPQREQGPKGPGARSTSSSCRTSSSPRRAEFADVVLPASTALEKTGTLHEHRPPRAGRPPGAAHARAGAGGLEDRLRDLEPDGLPDALRVGRRDLRRARVARQLADGARLRQPGRGRQALPLPRPRAHGRHRRHVRRGQPVPHALGPREVRPGRRPPPRREARRRVPVRAQHGPAPRALAHRAR